MKRKLIRTVLLSLISVVLLMIAVVAVFVAISMSKTPEQKSDFLPETLPGQSEGTTEPEIKRKEDCYTLLLLGTDSIGDNTDTVMLVSFDLEKKEVKALQIPRDTFVYADGKGRKLNSVFPDALERTKDTDATAREVVSLLEKGLCVPIDYYAVVDLACLRDAVDAIGGVTVDVPFDMYYVDHSQGLTIDLKKGPQLLDGEKAEQFIRYRSGYLLADIGRLDAQKLFISALSDRIKGHLSLDNIIGIVKAFIGRVKTSIPLSDAIYIASKVYESVDLSDIKMKTLEGEGYRGGVYYVLRKKDAIETVNGFIGPYEGDVSSVIFDPFSIFTDKDNEEINGIYLSSKESKNKEHNAKEIIEKGISIPLIK